jgi:putative sulfotransferase
MLHLHPDILSLSEVLSSLTSRALTDRHLDGPAFLERITTLSPFLRAAYRNGIRQGEILYQQGRHGDLPLDRVPPLALITLPFLDAHPLDVLDAAAPLIRERGAAPLEDHMRFLFEWLAGRYGKSVWVERSGDSLLFVERLAEMFPDARFVHLYRDGRDVALSMSNHPDFRAKVSYYQTLSTLGVNAYRTRQAYGIARWHAWLETFLVRALPISALTDAKVGAEACAAYWHRSTASGLSMLENLDEGRVHHLAYEQMVREPDDALRRLAHFIGVDAPPRWLSDAAALADVRAEKWRALSPENIKSLEHACGASLARLGYQQSA